MSLISSPVLIHVPHASTLIPAKQRPAFLLPDLQKELLCMTDWYCDALFACGRPMLAAKVSRLVCDMERFPQDSQEPMARKGMGFAYTRCADGSPLRVLTPTQKQQIFQEFYRPHQQLLAQMVADRLGTAGRCLIIDGHSFGPAPLPYEEVQEIDRPDFCIGTDDFHTPPGLWKLAEDFLVHAGHSVKINMPFSGTMVPLEYLGKDPRVFSVMIEINRKLYMDPDGQKNAGFESVHTLLAQLTERLERFAAD